MDRNALEIQRREERLAKSRAILELPDVVSRIADAAHAAGESVREMLLHNVRDYGTKGAAFESPLEAIFFAWWMAYEIGWSVTWIQHFSGPDLWLDCQEDVVCDGERFRLDFVVRAVGSQSMEVYKHRELFPKIAIELDGHEFHEKTKEQVARRNHRDRLLQANGWIVMHVSGSELARNPSVVVDEIHRPCREHFQSFMQKVVRTAV